MDRKHRTSQFALVAVAVIAYGLAYAFRQPDGAGQSLAVVVAVLAFSVAFVRSVSIRA
jgi:hypothetical protein